MKKSDLWDDNELLEALEEELLANALLEAFKRDLRRSKSLCKLYLAVRYLAQELTKRGNKELAVKIPTLHRQTKIPEYTIRRHIDTLCGYNIMTHIERKGNLGSIYVIKPFHEWEEKADIDFNNALKWALKK